MDGRISWYRKWRQLAFVWTRTMFLNDMPKS